MNALSTFVFFTRCEGPISWLIRRITGSQWSHMGIGFTLENGLQVYYECLLGNGFNGPKPVERLHNWVAKNPDSRAVSFVPLWLHKDLSQQKHVICNAWKGHVGYASWQLLSLWFFERLGKYIGFNVPNSPRRMVCSESVARILNPQIDLCTPDRAFDEVTPESAWNRIIELEHQRAGLRALAATFTKGNG